jgi:hypothetical protein
MSEQRAKQLRVDDGASEVLPEPSTVRPPFDLEKFARDSDSMIRVETTPPSGKPTAPPPAGMLPEYSPGLTSGTMHVLGSIASDSVPVLAVAREDLEWFEIAPYPRSLLRYVDGRQSIAAICAHARFKVDEALAAFHDLARDGLVTLQR